MSESGKPVDASFLSRWSRRKAEAAQDGAILPTEAAVVLQNTSTGAAPGAKVPETPHPEPTSPVGSEVRRELPSIDSLTHDADFSPFMAKDVDPGLRNQAMKKLFTDPHYQFGQMDKLDIYIDDYSQPDPIPLEMLRRMHQAKSLFLFDDEEKASPPQAAAHSGASDAPLPLTAEAVAAADAGVAAPPEAGTADESAVESAAAENGPPEHVGLAGGPGPGKSQ